MKNSKEKALQKNAGKVSGTKTKIGRVHAVKIVKIKNKYMFTKDERDKNDYDPEGVHTYIVFKDKLGRLRAIRTTHLYERKKQKQLEKEIIMAMKLPNVKYPSGITRGIIAKDIDGEALDLKKVKAIDISKENKSNKKKRATYLTKRQAKKAIDFAVKKGKKKKGP